MLLVTLISGDKVRESGRYRYDGHVLKDCGATVSLQDQQGLYYKQGETIPNLGSCNCPIRWRLVD